MTIRGTKFLAPVAGVALAVLAAGCSVGDLGLTGDDSASDVVADGVLPGDTDGGSFVGGSSSGAGDFGAAQGSGGSDSTDESGDGDGDGTDPDSGADDPPSGTSTIADPELSTDPDKVYLPGTCFIADPDGGEAIEVRCDEPHSIEIYAIVDLPGADGAPFQGLDTAIEFCNVEFLAITGVGLGLATVYDRSVLRPSEETWADGERDVTCYVKYPELVSLSMVDVNPVRSFGVVSIYGFEVGDCFIDFDDTETTFEPVSCDAPHDAEVFVDFEYPPGPYPGDPAIDEKSDELCFGQSFEDFIGLDYASSSIFALRSRPTEETWNLGDRTINCVLTDELVRNGSLRGAGI